MEVRVERKNGMTLLGHRRCHCQSKRRRRMRPIPLPVYIQATVYRVLPAGERTRIIVIIIIIILSQTKTGADTRGERW